MSIHTTLATTTTVKPTHTPSSKRVRARSTSIAATTRAFCSANDRINSAVREALHLPEHKVPSNIARYGNTSSATIPILMDELLREGKVKRGQLLCFMALGAGLNWGAALMRL